MHVPTNHSNVDRISSQCRCIPVQLPPYFIRLTQPTVDIVLHIMHYNRLVCQTWVGDLLCFSLIVYLCLPSFPAVRLPAGPAYCTDRCKAHMQESTCLGHSSLTSEPPVCHFMKSRSLKYRQLCVISHFSHLGARAEQIVCPKPTRSVFTSGQSSTGSICCSATLVFSGPLLFACHVSTHPFYIVCANIIFSNMRQRAFISNIASTTPF